jgi:hypothetical protein
VIRIVRVGECRQCGFCCGFVNGKKVEGACSHLDDNGKCTIHDRLNEYCPEHGRRHTECIEHPVYPLRKVNPKCGYRFYDMESGAEVINIELAEWDFVSKYG